MPSLQCMVATPTRELFSGEIYYADVPGAEGNYGVLSGHEMLVAKNSPGVLTLWLDEAGTERRQFALYEGATQVYQDRVIVLARFGVEVTTIDAEVVRKKVETIKERIADVEAHNDDVQAEYYGAVLETSKARLAWYETQLRVVEGVSAK